VGGGDEEGDVEGSEVGEDVKEIYEDPEDLELGAVDPFSIASQSSPEDNRKVHGREDRDVLVGEGKVRILCRPMAVDEFGRTAFSQALENVENACPWNEIKNAPRVH
jgi:hypothetical protein